MIFIFSMVAEAIKSSTDELFSVLH